MSKSASLNRYERIVDAIFRRHYKKGARSFDFKREEFVGIAKSLKIDLPDNLGDVIYSFRFRVPMPDIVRKNAPKGYHWSIELAGKGKYRFCLGRLNRIVPRPDLLKTKIPDATPEIISKYAQTDEQALLAKVRYNRLIDVFLGVAGYSLQSHWRTTVSGVGQIEIDEIYVAVNKHGQHFIVPVQAKGGSDEIGSVQTRQDIACCREKFPDMVCRAIAVQFLPDSSIAVFELALESEDIKVVEERHYRLVPHKEISHDDLKLYGRAR